MKTIWVATAMLVLASPALADLTVEYRPKSFGDGDEWMKCEVRMDRSRTERGPADVSGRHRGLSEFMIVRADRHVVWQLHPDEKTYYEFPWPDTANEYPPIFPSQLEADAYLQTGTPDSLRKGPWSNPKLTRTGRIETIRGIKVERVRVSAIEKGPPQSRDIVDLWLTVDYPQTPEIKRLLGVLAQHGDWWAPQIVPAALPAGNELIRSFAGSFTGIPLRLKMTVQGTGWFAPSQILSEIDLVSIDVGPVPDAAFEIPRGYRQVDVTSWKKARKEFLSRVHSQR